MGYNFSTHAYGDAREQRPFVVGNYEQLRTTGDRPENGDFAQCDEICYC